MDFPIESLHAETGPGVIEAALTHDHASAAADKAALFKTFIKIWAQRNNIMATFMAKWSKDLPGQSGHIHISLTDSAGKSAFYDPSKAYNISDTQRHFLAGQQRFMPQFLAMVAPTVNSFSRMVPGLWAPLDATWGVENRTCALRVIQAQLSHSALSIELALPMLTHTSLWQQRWPLVFMVLKNSWNHYCRLKVMRMNNSMRRK